MSYATVSIVLMSISKKAMKHFTLLLFFTSLVFFACKKPQVKTPSPFSKNITGRWNYFQKFYSPGSGFIYESTTGLRQWITFTADGQISSNTDNYKGFATYEILDSFKIKFISQSQDDRFYFYHIDSLENSLTLSPADFICIEGCGDIFKK